MIFTDEVHDVGIKAVKRRANNTGIITQLANILGLM
jgi:hypothetical protein